MSPETPSLPVEHGLLWRPITPGDVGTWFRLRTAVEEYDRAPERTAEHELSDVFKGSWRDPERDFIGGFDANGEMQAWGRTEFRPATSGTLAPVLLGGVHPRYRGLGLGRAVLAWTEARARQQLAELRSDLPARLRVFVDDHNPGAKSLAERAGFNASRWYVIMRRDLTEPLPAIALDETVRIEPYRPELDDEVRAAHNESFAADHWGSNPVDAEEWSLEVVGGEAFRPDWSFVAVDTWTERVVGYLISGAYQQDWEPQGYSEGWTDLLAVRREHRGKGVAAGLLTAAMAAYADAGMEYAGLDVDTDNPTGALGLYSRLGYVRAGTSVLYTKELPRSSPHDHEH